MATFTVQTYNHTAARFFGQLVNLTSLKAVLLNGSAVFNAAHTQLTDVTSAGANEVSGNGWAAGGVALAGEAVTTVETNDAMLDATDLSVAASGGNIGPAEACVIMDDAAANDPPLFWLEFSEPITAVNGQNFQIVFNVNGIGRVFVS